MPVLSFQLPAISPAMKVPMAVIVPWLVVAIEEIPPDHVLSVAGFVRAGAIGCALRIAPETFPSAYPFIACSALPCPISSRLQLAAHDRLRARRSAACREAERAAC